MKQIKKILALVLVAVMMMALSTVALAVDISIVADSTNIDPTAVTYTYYKIFDATYVSNTTTDGTIEGSEGTQASTQGFSYTIPATSPLLTITGSTASIAGITDITLTKSADGTKYIVKYTGEMTEAAAKSMATALQTKINSLTNEQKALLAKGTLTYDSAEKKYKATGLDKGYYLIESDTNTKLVLATTDINISEKNTYVTEEKTLADPADSSVQIGDIIPYKLTVKIPAGSNQGIVITDTYEDGLTPQLVQTTDSSGDYYSTTQTAGQVYVTAVSGDTSADASTYTANTAFAVSAPSSGSFTITLTDAQVTALAGKTIIFTYYAEVNEHALDSATSTENKADLKYGNDYDTTPSTVTVTTQTITLTKYDGTDTGTPKTPIAGAIFELRRAGAAVKLVKVSDTEYRVATPEEIAAYGTPAGTPTAYTDETTAMANNAVTTNVRTVAGTVITVKGLDKDVTYTWVETKAPTGYNPTTSDSTVTPAKDSVVNTDIENNKGTVLPGTGGIGTTIFYVVGGLMVAAAIVVLVTKRRMAGED